MATKKVRTKLLTIKVIDGSDMILAKPSDHSNQRHHRPKTKPSPTRDLIMGWNDQCAGYYLFLNRDGKQEF